MPLLKLQDIGDNTRLAIWKMNESLTFFENKLSEGCIINPDISNCSLNRKMEILAGRFLVQKLVGDSKICFDVDKYGKPFFTNHKGFFSISHTKGLVAAIYSEQHLVGIDVEMIHNKVERIKHKFLSKDELKYVEDGDLPRLTLLWSAKETIYKAYGKRQLVFDEHIKVENPYLGQHSFKARLEKDEFKVDCVIDFEIKDQYVLTYCSKFGKTKSEEFLAVEEAKIHSRKLIKKWAEEK